MKFLLSILVIIGNLNVLLANNDNCRVNDLNVLMVILRQLRTDFANLKIQHAELRQEISAIKDDKSLLPIVGFNARLSSNETDKRLRKVIFDTVITNQGEGYDNSTGEFTAPYTGLYFFSVQFCYEGNAIYEIYQERTRLTSSLKLDSDTSCSSVSTIAMVNKAEQVWVQTHLESINSINEHYGWNTFSGSLLNK
ncbi:complement C1q tumor necrosis factor-related protein 7-like [Ruditapes philippinarum]|uniref:complement C1q tumor necrosis factor-related protein 7-like n=1 Tax=Ruditapes philippinarum TaxID=129788 RepID=UPI00295AAC00|nr:complement C1q tumor necrosis factor-related protein 7-like [Ruditapes philippinarum]